MRIGYLVALLFVGLTSCQSDYVPKPRGYFRIELPQHSYDTFNSSCPFRFVYPSFAEIRSDMEGDSQYCWMNIHYPRLNANVHLSYKPIIQKGDFQHLISDAYTFVQKHNIKAEGITEEFIDNGHGAYGLYYQIGGNTASSLQFFLTDSNEHFLRGSLYFLAEPNKDSLAPLVNYIDKDLREFMQSFRWKDVSLENYR